MSRSDLPQLNLVSINNCFYRCCYQSEFLAARLLLPAQSRVHPSASSNPPPSSSCMQLQLLRNNAKPPAEKGTFARGKSRHKERPVHAFHLDLLSHTYPTCRKLLTQGHAYLGLVTKNTTSSALHAPREVVWPRSYQTRHPSLPATTLVARRAQPELAGKTAFSLHSNAVVSSITHYLPTYAPKHSRHPPLVVGDGYQVNITRHNLQ